MKCSSILPRLCTYITKYMPSHAVITLASVPHSSAEQMRYTAMSATSVEKINMRDLRGCAEPSTVSAAEVKGLGVRQIAKIKFQLGS